MTNDEVLELLTDLGTRLATVADLAHETWEQARHTLDRVSWLCEDVGRLREGMLSSADTVILRAVKKPGAGESENAARASTK
jgi:hypothetical protein